MVETFVKVSRLEVQLTHHHNQEEHVLMSGANGNALMYCSPSYADCDLSSENTFQRDLFQIASSAFGFEVSGKSSQTQQKQLHFFSPSMFELVV